MNIGDTIVYSDKLAVTSCGVCQIHFAMPANFDKAAREDPSVEFYCPKGHSLSYCDSKNDQLRRQVSARDAQLATVRARLDQERAEVAHQKRRVAAQKGLITKARKRVGNGVCPCCNRSFPALAAHMETQHPDYITKVDQT